MNTTKFLLIIFFINSIIYTNIYAKNNFFAEAQKLYKEKKFSQSKFNFEKDIVFNPKNEKSYLYLAKIFKEEKNEIMEEQNLNTVILINPKNEEAIFLLAALKIKKSDYTESKKLINNFKKVCKIFCEKEKELTIKLDNLEPK